MLINVNSLIIPNQSVTFVSELKETDWLVRVVEDKYKQFGVGTEHSLNKLIKDFISGLDKEKYSVVIKALTTWQKKGAFYFCMRYIGDVWGITLENTED